MTTFDNNLKKAFNNRKWLNRLFICSIGTLLLLLITALLFAGYYILCKELGTVFEFVAISILILWIGLLISYYAWAIYFYNINLGLTELDWADLRVKKENDPASTEIRMDNPNQSQSLGLPPGTIRGTLTLTLMVAALAMSIAYLGENSSLRKDEFFIDNFDFFKKAFLMMIAFYFGSKSLEYLSEEGKKKDKTDTKAKEEESTEKKEAEPISPYNPINHMVANTGNSETNFEKEGAVG